MSWNDQESGDVLSDGNGTYYTWETVKIPQGEEQWVKCIVEHSGNHSSHLAPLGETGVRLEAVVTLGGSEARVRERRAGCGSGVPGLNIIRSFFRKDPGAQSSWWIVSVSVAVVFIIGFCVYCCIKKRKTASATGRPGEKSGQGVLCVRFGSNEDFSSLLCSQLSLFSVRLTGACLGSMCWIMCWLGGSR